MNATAKDQEQNINELQRHWKNSILAATWNHCADFYDAMLCAREAVLNGLRYGCGEGQAVRFQVACHADIGMLRVRVSDPGPGHAFDLSIHDDNGRELCDEHRGLMLIRALCGRLASLRNGAELIMDFFWKGEKQ